MSDTETIEAETPRDPGAALATALIILTTVVLLGAVIVVNGVLKNNYSENAMF